MRTLKLINNIADQKQIKKLKESVMIAQHQMLVEIT